MVHERHALEGRSDEGRRPHDPQSCRRASRRLNPDAADQRLPGSHQRTLPGRQAKGARIHQPHDHTHRAVPDRRQVRLLEDQPTCRLTHSNFKRAFL
ncbi:MAG: hypothetical protein VB142_07275 [Burkholderia sp.]